MKRTDFYRLSILISSLFLAFHSIGQGYYPSGSRSMSMANASNTFTDAWAYFNNPAGLAMDNNLQAGLSYENRFLLKELQSQSAVVAIPLKVGVISVGGQTFGYRQFRSTKAGVGYSMKLSDRLMIGVQGNYQGLMLNENYGNKHTATAEIGILTLLTENWRVGVTVNNVGRAKLSEYSDDRFSTYFKLGTSYRFSKSVLMSLEFEKNLETALRVKSGIEYTPIENLYLRGGFATARTELTFGVGYDFGLLSLEIGSAYDQILGWSPNFSLTLDKKKEAN